MPKDASFAREPAKVARGIPPTALVLLSIGSVQLGAAIAKGLFDDVGPGGTVLFRISLSPRPAPVVASEARRLRQG